MKIDLTTLSPDVAGELLRDIAFKDEYEEVSGKKYKKLGCYGTFEVKEDWQLVTNSRVIESFNEMCDGDVSKSLYKHNKSNVYMAWHWDGDGTLLFFVDYKALVNTDCKKTHGWEWVIK